MKSQNGFNQLGGALAVIVALAGCASSPPIEQHAPEFQTLAHEPQIVLERELEGEEGLIVEIQPNDLFVVYGLWTAGAPGSNEVPTRLEESERQAIAQEE